MSIPQQGGEPITGRSELVEYLEAGCKPKADWRIGTEHEKFGFKKGSLKPLTYEEAGGIRDHLEGLMQFGWEGVYEGETLIGLTQNGASVSLEPGGQVELSGAPLKHLHETCEETQTHLEQVKTVCEEFGTGMLGLGASPKWSLEDTPVMPKGRYGIMRRYMQEKGALGLDMMFRTCTIQVNLDFESEADMVKKLRVGLALQPIATALFANSPFLDGKPNGYLSYRSAVWLDTDPDRTGMLPFVFEDGFGFERWVDYALSVPMYFIYRNGTYNDVSGKCFQDFLDHKLPGFEQVDPTLGDWADHLTTIFPEARIKRFLEMRGADGGPWSRICALPALWVGLLYNSTALDAAWDVAKRWDAEARDRLRKEVPQQGLQARIGRHHLLDLACEVLDICHHGLKERGTEIGPLAGDDERHFLNSLRDVVEAGRTPAEQLLELYEKEWGQSVDPVFDYMAY